MNVTACKTTTSRFSSTHAIQNSGARVLGVVGGIGAGKTLFCRVLADSGAAVIEADRVARTLHNEPEIRSALRREFGDGVFRGGVLDRKRLAERVFTDPKQLDKLDAIMLPMLSKRIRDEIDRLSPNHRLVAVDMANLFQAGLDAACDAVVRIRAPLAARKDRLLARGMSEEDIAARVRAQSRRIRGRADWIIDNCGDVGELARKAHRIYDKMTVSVRAAASLQERTNP